MGTRMLTTIAIQLLQNWASLGEFRCLFDPCHFLFILLKIVLSDRLRAVTLMWIHFRIRTELSSIRNTCNNS